jgi:co-chaperonin GroES (HSP10)
MKPIAILDRVIVKPHEANTTTASGIVVQVRVGAIVHYSPKQFVERDGFKVLNEKDILFVEE